MTPKAWELKSVGEIAKVSAGGTPSRANPRYWNGDIPWLTTSAIDFCTVDSASEFITQAGLSSSAAKVYPAGTLLMAMYGQGATRGRVAILGMEAAFNQACAAIVPREGVSELYLFYSLMLRYKEIREIGHGGNQKNLNSHLIRSIKIPLPCQREQHAVVRVIRSAEAAVQSADRVIARKMVAKKALADEVLTGRRRVTGFSRRWREHHLGGLFSERIESNRTDLRLLAVTGSEGVVSRDTLAKRDTSSEDKAKYLRVCPGDIAYNTMRMWQGVFGLSTLEGIVSPAYTVCTPCTKSILPEFVEQLFKAAHIIHKFKRYSQGLVDDTLNLKFHHFAEIKVVIPDIDEQRQIASVLRSLDDEIAVLRRQRNALDRQKNGLMQKLLTGEIRLKEFRT